MNLQQVLKRDVLVPSCCSAPCTPRLSDVEIDCLTNSAWVMWDEAAGAEDYVVMATDSQGDRQTFECNSTSDGACALPPLACSRNVTFTVTARDQQCPSGPSNAVTTETGEASSTPDMTSSGVTLQIVKPIEAI